MKSISKKQKAFNRLKKLFYIVLTIFVLLLVWEGIALLVNNNILFPNVDKTFEKFFIVLIEKEFYYAFLATLLRSILSFLLAIVVSVLLYFLSKTCEFAKTFCQSLVSILRSIPTIAIILFLLLWTSSEIAPVVIATLVTMPILFAGLEGMKIDNEVKLLAKLYEIKGINYFKFIWFPHLQNNYVPLLSSTSSLNLKVLVAGEVLAHTYVSLGGMMQSASVYFEIGQLVALAVVTILTAVILEKLLLQTKKLKFKVKKD